MISLIFGCNSDNSNEDSDNPNEDSDNSNEDSVNNLPSLVQNITYELVDFPNITFSWSRSTDVDGDDIKYLISISPWVNVGLNDDYVLDVYPKDPVYETMENSLTINLSELDNYTANLNKYRIVVYAVEKEFNDYNLLYSESGYFGGDYFLDNYLDFVPLGTEGVHYGDIELIDHLQFGMLENHQIHTLNGNLIIRTYCTTESYRPYEINTLENLRGLKTINGNLVVGIDSGNTINTEIVDNYSCVNLTNNISYSSLDGLQDLESINGDLLVIGTPITNLNDFTNLVNVDGKIGFYLNYNLSDFCLLSNLFQQNNFELYQNAYNPTLDNFLNNNCSN